MIIDTISSNKIEEGLCKYFGNREFIITIKKFKKKYQEQKYITPNEIREAVEKLISNKENDVSIQEIYMYHLSRTYEKIECIYPLSKLLTTANFFSNFLLKNKITFVFLEQRINMLYKNEIHKIKNKMLLNVRLKGDHCVNGFLFKFDIKESSYYIPLRNGPELLSNINEELNLDLMEKYKEKTNYYLLKLRVKMSDLNYYNNREPFDEKDFIIECLLKLIYIESGEIETSPEPVICLDDFLCAEVVDRYLLEK